MKKIFKNKQDVLISLIFIMFLILAMNTPLNQDDWAWGTKIGMDRLHNKFRNYNGRYVGNLIEMLLTRTTIMRYMIVALCNTLTVVLLNKIVTKENQLVIPLGFITIMLMPTTMFASTYSWIAGFSNYIVSIILVLLYLIIVKNLFNNEKQLFNIVKFAGYTLGMLLSCLIVENVSLFFVCMNFYLFIYLLIYKRNSLWLAMSLFVGSILGTGIMFSNEAYGAFLGGSNYKQVDVTEGNIISKVFSGYFNGTAEVALHNNSILMVALSLIIIACAVKFSGKYPVLSLFNSLVSTSYTLLIITNKYIVEYPIFGTKTGLLLGMLSFIYLFVLFLTITFFVENKVIKRRLIYYYFGLAIAIGPMTITTPLYERSLLLCYFMIIIIMLELLSTLEIVLPKQQNILKYIMPLILAIMIMFSYIFIRNGETDKRRMAYVNEQINNGNKEIKLLELPYGEYMYRGKNYQMSPFFSDSFKMYYHLPKDSTIKIISYEQWDMEVSN